MKAPCGERLCSQSMPNHKTRKWLVHPNPATGRGALNPYNTQDVRIWGHPTEPYTLPILRLIGRTRRTLLYPFAISCGGNIEGSTVIYAIVRNVSMHKQALKGPQYVQQFATPTRNRLIYDISVVCRTRPNLHYTTATARTSTTNIRTVK